LERDNIEVDILILIKQTDDD